MGNKLYLKQNSMRFATIAIVVMAIAMIKCQALRDKVVCCKDAQGNQVPTINSCGSRRRLQALAPTHCAAKLNKHQRRLQAIVKKEFKIEACVNYSARRLEAVVSRRNQALVYKCPVTVDGWRCFTND